MPDDLLREEPYQTPAGLVDLPFSYVYDATGLSDGVDYSDIQLALQGDTDFILRRVAGVDSVVASFAAGGRYQLYNASRSFTASAPVHPAPNMVILPEKRYPVNSAIAFDLTQVARASVADGGGAVYSSYLAFFGVKRYPEGAIMRRATPYRYKERRYSYEYPLTIAQGHYSVAGGPAPTPPQRVVIALDNYDFELMAITISSSSGSGALNAPDFALTIYDPTGHQLSNLPLPQGYVNSGMLAPHSAAPYQGAFPVPSIVYPAGGQLVVDITSLLPVASVPASYNLSFQGVWRIPC